VRLLKSEHRRDEHIASQRLPRDDDPKEAAGKIAIFQYLTVLVFVFLVSGFWQLQVKNPELYSEAAERNRIKSTPLLAPRGKILDRDGRVIVDNKASYSLLLNRDEIKWEHLPAIANALQLDYGDLSGMIRRSAGRPQIIVKDQLTRDEIAWIESHQDLSAYPEMQLIRSWRRQYPQTDLPRTSSAMSAKSGRLSWIRRNSSITTRATSSAKMASNVNTTKRCAAWMDSSACWSTIWAANAKWRRRRKPFPARI
jgi:hypothetical protein